jgi:hypothetical protein
MAFWQECNRKIQKLSCVEDDGMALIQFLWDKLDTDDLLLAFIVARRIWLRRNSFIFEGVFIPPQQLESTASDSLEFFLLAQRAATSGGPQPQLDAVWIKPLPGILKLNWDAAVDDKEKMWGAGVAVRDS